MAKPATPPGYELLFNKQQTVSRQTETAVFIGNCIAEAIAWGMASSDTATRLFNFFPVPLHIKKIESPDVQEALASAKFIFVQNIAGSHRDTIDHLRRSDSEVINFPDLIFRSAWPFDSYSGFKDPKLSHRAEEYEHDGALAALRNLEPDKGARFRRYRDLDFELANRIDRTIEAQRRFLESIDENSELQIGRFIIRRFQDSQCFYNTSHPSGVVYQELCSFCWRRIGLSGSLPSFHNVDGSSRDSIPIHPLIARRLDLKWANELTRYNCRNQGAMTWAEWAKSYIERLG